VHLWDRVEQRDGIEYKINRQHPIISGILNALAGSDSHLFESLLRHLERHLPAEALYADMASNPRAVIRDQSASEEELFDLAGRLKDACRDDDERLLLMQRLMVLEPFVHYPDETRLIIARMQHG
jgi:hypothetical protein